MFYNPETCGGDGGDFEMMGWWRVEPGSCVLAYANDLEDLNQFWYYFAKADDGAFWAGPFAANVPHHAFGGSQSCWGDQKVAGSDFIQIGYRELDIGSNDDYALTFVSVRFASEKRAASSRNAERILRPNGCHGSEIYLHGSACWSKCC
jgi:hypothetical protein